MVELDATQRGEVNAEFMEEVSVAREEFGNLTKADILAAVNALDTYLNDNAATINQTLPVTARTALTASQKARLLTYVIRKRYIVGA